MSAERTFQQWYYEKLGHAKGRLGIYDFEVPILSPMKERSWRPPTNPSQNERELAGLVPVNRPSNVHGADKAAAALNAYNPPSPLLAELSRSMYRRSTAIDFLYIIMGKFFKVRPKLPFRGSNRALSAKEHSHPGKQAYTGPYDNSPVPVLTVHSFIMGVFVSMGGFIFGYDTGQISGFLGMKDFQERFGQRNHDGSGYHFTNVRSGLIVALVSSPLDSPLPGLWFLLFEAVYWYAHGCPHRRSGGGLDWAKVEYLLVVYGSPRRIDCPDECG